MTKYRIPSIKAIRKIKKRYIILAALTVVFLIGVYSFWHSVCSPTRIAFVNYQVISLGEISKANDNSFIKLKEESLSNIDDWTDYDVILINGMGLRTTEEQRTHIQNLVDGGLKILTTAATNPANLFVSIDEWDADSLKLYLSAGGRKNYRNFLNYIRNEVDGKLLFTHEVGPVEERRAQLLYHPNLKDPTAEDELFVSIKDYDRFLSQHGLLLQTAPRIIITGMMGDATDLILKLEETGNVVYATRNIAQLIKSHSIDSISPSAIINMAHGRLGDYAVEYLKERNIPLFSTVNVNRMTEDWENDKQGMYGGFFSQSIITPEIDGMIRPFVLFSIRKGKDGLPEAYTIPERLASFVDAVNKHIALQKKANKDKRIAIIYFKGPGANSLVASGMDVVQSLHNFLSALSNNGYDVSGLPASAAELEEIIQRRGSVFGTYAEGAQARFLTEGNPLPISKTDFQTWVDKSFNEQMQKSMHEVNGDYPGSYLSLDENTLGLPVIRFGNVAIMPQMPAGTGGDSFKMVHGTETAPPYPYIAEYLWIQNAFNADALIHFGTHGSLEYTPGKQVALSQNCWSDRLVGATPHFYFYTIANVGEAMIAKRRSYAGIVSYLTPPFMESNLRNTYNRLSGAIDDYNRVPDTGKSLVVKKLTVEMGIHRDLHLDSVMTQPYTEDEIARIESFAEELCNEKITSRSYTMGIPYETEHINTSVYAMATDPIAYSLLALDKLKLRAAIDTEKHPALFTSRYLTPAKTVVSRLLDSSAPVTDETICQIANISTSELHRAHHIDSIINAPQEMMSMMMGMANEMPAARKSVTPTNPDTLKKITDTENAKKSGMSKQKMREMGKGMDPKKALAIAKMMGASPEQLKKMKAAMRKSKKGGSSNADMTDAHTSRMTQMPPAMQAIMDNVAEAGMLTKEDKELARIILEIERTILNVNNYKTSLLTSPRAELENMLNALAGGYIAPSSGGDVISNPNAVPTGRNLYGINSEACPTEQAWEKGKELAENTIRMYRSRHNDSIPHKVSYTLWSSEFIETGGATIAQCLYMLGIEPIRDAFGRVTDIRLIPSEELGRSRIDVVVQTSGQLRDLAASRLFLISRAVEMAANAKDDKYSNLVREGVNQSERILVDKGMSPKEAREVSKYRVFGGVNGNYGTGIQEMTMASDRWDKENELAEVYLNNMGAFYGSENDWEDMRANAFEAALSNTDAVIQPRQSNTWGALSLDHVYEFMGGLNLAVRNVTGKDPDAYLSDYRNRNRAKMQEVKEAIGVESRTTLFNPTYIKEKMKGGANDANTFAELIQNTYGWNVMKPEAIDGEMWDEIYDTYVQDKYNLNSRQFFEKENPFALQEMTAVMMETARKGYWKATQPQLKEIAKLHTELVNKYGASGSGMVSDNLKLQDFIAQQVPETEAREYKAQISKERGLQVNQNEGKVLKKEELIVANQNKTIVSNIVVAVIVLSFICAIAILIRRRRRAMQQ